jgi:hypothetical protein
VLALEIAEELEAALEQFAAIAEDLLVLSFRFPIPTFCGLRQIGKVIEQFVGRSTSLLYGNGGSPFEFASL